MIDSAIELRASRTDAETTALDLPKKTPVRKKGPPPPPPKHFIVNFEGKVPMDERTCRCLRPFFAYMTPAVRVCKRQLCYYLCDLYPPSRKHNPKTSATHLAANWNKSVKKGKNPNLIWAAFVANKSSFLWAALIIIPLIGVQIALPYITQDLSEKLSPNKLEGKSISDVLKQTWGHIIGVVAAQTTQTIFESCLWYVLYDVLVRFVGSTLDVMVNKVLAMSDIARQSSASSNMTNLLFSDTMRIANMLQFLYYYITIPINFVINLVYLGVRIDPSALACLIALIVFIPAFYYIINGFNSTLVSLMSLTDKRVQTVTEVLDGIKVVKLFTMEEIQHRRVMNSRNAELKVNRKFELSLSIFSIIGRGAAPVMSLFAFLFMSMNDKLRPDNVYTAAYLFMQLGRAFVFLPAFISWSMESGVSASRIRAFLTLPTVDRGVVERVPMTDDIENAIEVIGKPSFCYGLLEDKVIPPLLDGDYEDNLKRQKDIIRGRNKLISKQKKEAAALLKCVRAGTISVPEDECRLIEDFPRTLELVQKSDESAIQTLNLWSARLNLPPCDLVTKVSAYDKGLYRPPKGSSQYDRVCYSTLHALAVEGLYATSVEQQAFHKRAQRCRKDPEQSHHILLERYRKIEKMDDSPIALHELELTIRRGELVGLFGTVGCGKTSLFSALLGELRLHRSSRYSHENFSSYALEDSYLIFDYETGHSMPENRIFDTRVRLAGRIAYFTQASVIFSGSIRDNILFYRPYDEERYQEVCKICCLIPDLLMQDYGDLTEIGEKGVSLSGGQKARVALARAVYADADIYFLDDPLSAVDAHVGQQLWENVILGYLRARGKTVIIASHQTQYFKDCDRLLQMASGKVIYNECMSDVMNADPLERPEFLRQVSSADTISGMQTVMSATGIVNAALRAHPSMPGFSSENVQKNEYTQEMLDRAFLKTPPDVQQQSTEELEAGSLSCKMYKRWFKSGTYWRIGLYLIIPVCWQVAYQYQYVFVQAWASTQFPSISHPYGYFGIYAAIVIVAAALSWGTAVGTTPFLLESSRSLFQDMITSLLHSPLRFFDTTPLGRILNRLSKDFASVDMLLFLFIMQTTQGASEFLGILVTMCVLAWPTIIIIVPIVIVYFVTYGSFRRSAPQMKRLEGAAKSPVYNLCNEVMTSLQCIRAYQAEMNFVKNSRTHLDAYLSAYYSHLSLTRWFILRLNIISTVFGFLIILGLSIIAPQGILDNYVGLIIGYSFWLQMLVSWFITTLGLFESEMTSVERIIEYTALPPEDIVPKECQRVKELAAAGTPWPRKEGAGINVKDLRYRYRPELSLTLKGCTFEVRPGEHVGVVGRTGAGKSSLTQAFFRIAEADPGSSIEIDGVNILTDIGLYQARGAFAIIPQEPFLFSGTLRQSLCVYSSAIAEGLPPPPGVERIPDEKLWRVLEQVQMREYFEKQPGGLDAEIAANGDNLSAGQRQLVCVARALVRDPKIVILDEATAQVDRENDRLIQDTIRETMASTTIFSIAHRLDTVIDFDRILVVDAGKIAEYDTPANLLRREGSIFSQLVEKTGPETAQHLRDVAFESERRRAAVSE
ncbi:Multidrug resistance-associated protein 1 [Giardia muris]|uniref:Multidrug resistance-associated protein 1 n=1 Tax=Giardia muris TaxID=5742 RepID=A0A4Z1TBA5_GIAMU|nr:Multidrug resistance-associated protein 1 [Giardia muris]|eukprot:TNJ29811.1 Multidrug resistance-associated protein 1 [Giardia muris]